MNESMPYRAFEAVLDSGLDHIKASLPYHFSSADFIKVAKDSFPIEYAAILQISNYQSLHRWIARWYLNRHFAQVGNIHIQTIMGHQGSNILWVK